MFEIENLTRTIASFEPTAEQFENVQTGRRMTAGVITFAECGHSYTWRPWGLRDNEPMPATGGRTMCADCIQAAIDAAKTDQPGGPAAWTADSNGTPYCTACGKPDPEHGRQYCREAAR